MASKRLTTVLLEYADQTLARNHARSSAEPAALPRNCLSTSCRSPSGHG